MLIRLGMVPVLRRLAGLEPQVALAPVISKVSAAVRSSALAMCLPSQILASWGEDLSSCTVSPSTSGMVAAPLGGWLGMLIPEPLLLSAFAALMLVIAVRMWAKASDPTERASPAALDAGSGPACRRDPEGKLRMTSRCASVLTATGLAVGLLSGLFGVGGGFLIVPALVAFASMGVPRAVGTSLLVMTLVGAAGVASQAAAGRSIPLDIAGSFVAGSIPGLLAGSFIGRRFTGPLFSKIFAAAIVLVATFMIAKTFVNF